MEKLFLYFYLIILVNISLKAQDSVAIKGQASVWGHYNPSNYPKFTLGGRYIPTFQYSHKKSVNKLMDMEASANLYGSAGFYAVDSISFDSKIKPYRAWIRYSTDQLELRLGLQKINFGQAVMLRPLMWFDQLDPRDPLQLTDGVYGLLGRYYFLNNANFWLWGLWGNNKTKTWEVGNTSKNKPEFGGRFQLPVPSGEAALSYHYRSVDSRFLPGVFLQDENIPENRIGVDAKWDLGVGLWFEGSWIHKNRDIGALTNQQFATGGIDYTFAIGKGVNLIYEHMLISYSRKAFQYSAMTNFSALSASYPLGISDNISSIFYYDWNNRNLYSFINWKHQFNNFYMYIIGYWNPGSYNLPQQSGSSTLFSGKGIQIMFVYNH